MNNGSYKINIAVEMRVFVHVAGVIVMEKEVLGIDVRYYLSSASTVVALVIMVCHCAIRNIVKIFCVVDGLMQSLCEHDGLSYWENIGSRGY